MSERILFYPWLRQGWSGAALPADVPGAQLTARVTLAVQVRVNNAAVESTVSLLGPGDVVGIDQRQVIRTDPAPAARAFEPNFLACIDFDRPDFPWLFTPASANAQNRLRPWVCLIVVRRQEGVTLTVNARRPLPVLTIERPALPREELPDLASAWAWAHAQVAPFEGALDAALQAHPERSLSRLICPRRLEPSASYYACVVPAFEAGRIAGLGQPVTTAVLGALAPAWASGEASAQFLELPVYHSWEFATGPGGDFASLAALLRARPLDATTGTVDLDVGEAGEGLPVIPNTSTDRTLRLEGALLSPKAVRKGFATNAGVAFQQRLATLIVQPSSPDEDPIVGPPLYGDRAAGATTLPAANAAPQWLRDLNLDPRYRAVSALGRQVIQQHQEQILASVWQQTGDIERANTLLRNARFAQTVSDAVVRKRFAPLPPDALLQLTRSVQGRLADGQSTVRSSLKAHHTADAAASPAFRRVARPRGRIMRSLLPSASRTVLGTFSKLATNALFVTSNRPVGGMVTLEAVESRFRGNGGTRPVGELVSWSTFQFATPDAMPKVPAFEVRTPDPWQPANTPPQPVAPFGATDSFSAGRLRAAYVALLPKMAVPPLILIGPPVPLDVGTISKTASAELTPWAPMVARLQRVIVAPPSVVSQPATDPFDPILATPEIERPMYEPLRDLFPRLMLPGIGGILDDTAAALVTNPRFVEAFLLGLNHELGRELLWRGFPARSRFTYFRRFWDRRGQPGQAGLPPEVAEPDVPAIDEWAGAKHLGEIAEGSDGQVVVLIRGELTRRFPNAIYYLTEAKATPGAARPSLGTRELFPSFRGTLGADVLFFGFAIGEAAVKGGPTDPGWFFVIQQPPGEPRFGIDAGATGAPIFLTPEADAAQTARRLLRPPVRVAIHASSLLP